MVGPAGAEKAKIVARPCTSRPNRRAGLLGCLTLATGYLAMLAVEIIAAVVPPIPCDALDEQFGASDQLLDLGSRHHRSCRSSLMRP